MNQGRRDDQERDSLIFFGRCFIATFGIITLGMVCHDGNLFPWVNLGGLVGLGMTLKVAAVIK